MASSIATAYIRLLPDATGIVDSVSKELNDSKAASASKSAGEKIGAGLSSAASKVMPLSLGVAAIGTAAIKTTMDFDSSMSNVQAISGATAAEMDQLRTTAREMGAATSFSASEAGDAMGYMAMAGWKAQDMISGIPGILSLAEASGEGLATTSDIVTDALTAFGMSAGQAGELSNIMAAASSNANTNVSMLGESFKYVAPVAGALGMSADDTAVALGLMANAGIKSSQAGTSLRAALTNLANPSDKMQAAMDRLGISLTNDNGEVKSMAELMDHLREKMAVSSEATRENAIATALLDGHVGISHKKLLALSGAEQEYAAIMGIGSDYLEGMTAEEIKAAQARYLGYTVLGQRHMTEEEYQKVCHGVGEELITTGKAEQAAAAATIFGKNAMSGMLAIVNAAPEDYEKLKNAVANSGETFVRTADGSVMPMGKALEQGLEIVEEYDGAAAGMAATMRDNLSGQLTILGSQLQELAISSINTIMPTIRDIVGGIQGVVNWLNGLDEGHKNLIVKLGLVVAAAGPVLSTTGSIITGITSVSKAIKGANGLITAAGGVPGILQKISVAGSNMATTITNTVGSAFAWFSSQSTAWGVQIGALGTVAIGVADAILVAYDVKKLQEAWSTYHEALLTHNKEAEQALSNYAKLYETKGKEVADQWAQMVYQIDTSSMNMDEAQKAIAAKVETYWDDVPTNMWDGFKQGWDHYFGSGEGGGIIGLGKDAFTGLVDGVKGLLGINSPSKVFQDIGSNTSLGYYQGFDSEWAKTVLGNVKNLIAQFPEAFKSLTGTITNVGKEIVGGLSKGISGAWNGVSSTVSGIAQKIPQFFTNLPQNLSNVGQNIIGKLSSGMSTAWSKGSSFLSKIGASIGNAFSKVPASMQTIGSNISTGLSNGISKGSHYVSEGMKAISGFVNTFASDLDKAKESMIVIGGNLLTGLRNGIVQKANEALGAVKQAATNVVNTVKGVFGVHSPSKVFEEIGENLMEGLVVGIDNNGNTVTRVIEDIAYESNEAAWEVGEKIFSMLLGGVDKGSAALSGSLGSVHEYVKKFMDAVNVLSNHMKTIGNNLMVSMANGIIEGTKKVTEALQNSINTVTGFASSVSSSKKSSSKKTSLDIISGSTSEAIISTGKVITGVAKNISDSADTIVEALEDVQTASESVFGITSGSTSETIISTGKAIVGTMKSMAKSTSDIVEAFEDVQTASEDILDVVEEYASGVQTAYDNIAPNMVTAGKNIMNSLSKGIVQAANSTINTAVKTASSLVKDVKVTFGVNSPSKVFEEIGEDLMEGLAVGIDENGDTVETALTDFVKSSEDTWEIGEKIFSTLVKGVGDGSIFLAGSLDKTHEFFQKFMDSFKPLNDYMEVAGRNMMISMANGISRGAEEAAKAMNSAVKAISSAASSATSGVSSIKIGTSSTKTSKTSSKSTGVSSTSTAKKADSQATDSLKGVITEAFESVQKAADDISPYKEQVISEAYSAIQTASENLSPHKEQVIYEPYKSSTQQASAAETIVSALGEQLSKIKVVLNDGTLVGHMTPGINRELGTMTYNQRREVLV